MIRPLYHRLSQARVWIALQFILTLLFILLGLAWTRLPDKHLWQVALSLLIPLLLAISALELQAGTIRKLAVDDGHRVKLVWGAVTLVVWIAVGWAAWAALDWCDDQIWNWASYLNSIAPPHVRATFFTYQHIGAWLTWIEWVFRWIVVPAKVIPWAAASAQWGFRLPWRRIIRLLWNWRWWAGVVVAALMGVWLPSHFFDKVPSGSVSAQVWAVGFKLAGAYLLAITSWVVLLAWWAVLFTSKQAPPPDFDLVTVAVPTGPPDRNLQAKADIPPSERSE